MSTNRRTIKHELNRIVRSAKRTLRRCVGLGPQKITNSNVGTEATQCGKFARFDELYSEYKMIPSLQIQTLMENVRSLIDFMNELPETFHDECLGTELMNDIDHRLELARDIVNDLPTTLRYYNVLKTEMGFFLSFLHNFYMAKKLMCPTPTLSLASTPRNSFSLPFSNWSRVSLSDPFSKTAPVSSFNTEAQGNMRYYTNRGPVLRRGRRTRHRHCHGRKRRSHR